MIGIRCNVKESSQWISLPYSLCIGEDKWPFAIEDVMVRNVLQICNQSRLSSMKVSQSFWRCIQIVSEEEYMQFAQRKQLYWADVMNGPKNSSIEQTLAITQDMKVTTDLSLHQYYKLMLKIFCWKLMMKTEKNQTELQDELLNLPITSEEMEQFNHKSLLMIIKQLGVSKSTLRETSNHILSHLRRSALKMGIEISGIYHGTVYTRIIAPSWSGIAEYISANEWMVPPMTVTQEVAVEINKTLMKSSQCKLPKPDLLFWQFQSNGDVVWYKDGLQGFDIMQIIEY